MYLVGYSLDNLSLMALTISTGFVVDDAIVVLENISRYRRSRGCRRWRPPSVEPSEIGFTVLSMSLSLVAVFIPILLMGGIVGRLFREFAVTLLGGDPGVAGGLAHHHADDVRPVAEAASRTARMAGCYRVERADLRWHAARLCEQPDVGAAARFVRCWS